MKEDRLGIEQAQELFNLYAELFNQEFHDQQSAKDMAEECVSIASALLESGFVILTRFKNTSEKINCSDDTVQTVITLDYDLALFKHQIPIGRPLATAAATTKIFGPPAPAVDTHPISTAEEALLNSVLSSIPANKSNTR